MMKTWAITDVGLVRKENQDAYRIARGGDVCVVCDGMGGAAGGQIASTLAAETYAAELEKIPVSYTHLEEGVAWRPQTW